MKKRNLFLMDIDNTILETGKYIVNKYNEQNDTDELGKDEYLMLDDFTNAETFDLIPYNKHLYYNLVEEVNLYPERLERVKGVTKFFRKYVKDGLVYFVSCRKYASFLDDALVQKLGLYQFNIDYKIFLVKDWEAKLSFYDSIILNAHKKYNIFIFEDMIEALPHYYYDKEAKFFVRRKPWNTGLHIKDNSITYFNDFHDMCYIFDLYKQSSLE